MHGLTVSEYSSRSHLELEEELGVCITNVLTKFQSISGQISN